MAPGKTMRTMRRGLKVNCRCSGERNLFRHLFPNFLLVLFGFICARAFSPDGWRHPYALSRQPFDFLCGSKRFRLSRAGRAHAGFAEERPEYASPSGELNELAEVSRNRTDQSRRARLTGFEVLGGHQPTCTSALILKPLVHWRKQSLPLIPVTGSASD